jgi:hypothetical protein
MSNDVGSKLLPSAVDCFISWLRDLTRNSNRLHMLANPVTEMVEAAL